MTGSGGNTRFSRLARYSVVYRSTDYLGTDYLGGCWLRLPGTGTSTAVKLSTVDGVYAVDVVQGCQYQDEMPRRAIEQVSGLNQ